MYGVMRDLHLGLETRAHMGRKCYSGWRWQDRLNPDQGKSVEKVGLYSARSGRVLKIRERGRGRAPRDHNNFKADKNVLILISFKNQNKINEYNSKELRNSSSYQCSKK